MNSGYELIEYSPEFKERVLALQTHLWGPNLKRNRAYFEWKHERNPYFTSPVAILAVRGDEVIGMRSLMGSCWEVGRGRPPIVLPYADDFTIAPEHRDSGLAGAIMTALLKRAQAMGAPYLLNLSAGATTVLHSLAAGWRSGGPMLPIGRFMAGGAEGETPLPFAALDEDTDARHGPDGIAVSRIPRPEAMASLVERCGYDGRIRHLREARFLAWRFQNPHYEYRFLFRGDDPLDGYLVLRANDRGVRLVDWEASDARGLVALLEFAISKGNFAEILAWEAAQSAEAARILRAHDFQPVDLESRQHGRPAVLVRTTGPVSKEWLLGEHRVLDPASWDMRLLYSMHG